MKNATMLFKEGGPHVFEPGGKGFHYIIVDESEVEAKYKEGWLQSPFAQPVKSEPKATEKKAK